MMYEVHLVAPVEAEERFTGLRAPGRAVVALHHAAFGEVWPVNNRHMRQLAEAGNLLQPFGCGKTEGCSARAGKKMEGRAESASMMEARAFMKGEKRRTALPSFYPHAPAATPAAASEKCLPASGKKRRITADMKSIRFSLFGKLMLLFALACPAASAAPTKVACVGDSITYGLGIANRQSNSYPAQLQKKMDAAAPGQWEVKNFGVSAMSLMKNTSRPYMGRAEYRASVAWAADIVIIMLGTNDSNGMFRDRIPSDFEKDYHSLIASYRAGRAEGQPRIILMLPPTCYLTGEVWHDPAEPVIQARVLPLIRKVAEAEKLELIDLTAALGTAWQPKLMPDKLHPSAAGATLMVEKIAPVVMGEEKTPQQ